MSRNWLQNLLNTRSPGVTALVAAAALAYGQPLLAQAPGEGAPSPPAPTAGPPTPSADTPAPSAPSSTPDFYPSSPAVSDYLHHHYAPHFRASLGVVVGEVSGPLAAHVPVFDGRPGYGLVVNYVAPESPAVKAGIERYDIITAIGNERLYSVAQYVKLLDKLQPGQAVKIQVIHPGANGKVSTLDVKLGYAEHTGSSIDAPFNPQGTPGPSAPTPAGYNLPGFGSTGMYVYPPPRYWRVPGGYRSGLDPTQAEPADYNNTEDRSNEPLVTPGTGD